MVNRGSVIFWFSEDAISGWHPCNDNKSRGGQRKFSDIAIETCLILRCVYKLGLRQTEGFVNSIIDMLCGNIVSPDFSTISRRSEHLTPFKVPNDNSGSINILIDSTGLKFFGPGQWCEGKHGKRRKVWRKLHMATDQDNMHIVSATLTPNNVSDSSQVPNLLDQIENDIIGVKADGAYDDDNIRRDLEAEGVKTAIPPPINATLSKNANTNPTQRDKDIMRIQKEGRQKWEYASGYTLRSLAENSMYRFKNCIGDKLRTRTEERQNTEINIAIKIINTMTKLGMPNTVRVYGQNA